MAFIYGGGLYTIETRGNGFTALVKRVSDGESVFFQGEDAAEFQDYLTGIENANFSTAQRHEAEADYISNYFLGIDEAKL